MRRWILIADASEARIFATGKDYKSLRLVQELKHAASRERAQELGSAPPGRLRKGMGSQTRSAMEPRTDPHRLEVEQFAKELAELVQAARLCGEFDELVLIALPRFLGLLCKVLDAGTTRDLIRCIAMNATHVAERELPTLLATAMENATASHAGTKSFS